MRRTISLIVGLSLLLASCSSSDANTENKTFRFYAPGGKTVITYDDNERQPIPNFTGEDLLDPNKTISLSDFDGQVVVLNAWGQWCGPCRTETDDLQEVQEAIVNRGGTVLGINVRDYNISQPQDWVKDNGLTYPNIYDPPFKTATVLGGLPASVVPTTIVLDKQHRPAAVFLQEITAKQLLEVVEPLL
ncbi:TlpA family protein disulfide reductase [Corynebacterium aquilae]|uniref:Effector protein n=1 Tax=Corynebacterium aquilae DSM 44791 TaxID=1431546 RepID=A0A1L7CDU6_9CORY|nr:TlpA disulfide reductase family protein [Corynebacterium aquilae]APT83953.1 effector protein [Corynebacterium aquilae DSM 44791]